MKEKIYILFIIILFFNCALYSQNEEIEAYGYIIEGKIVNGDTIPHIFIKEIIVFPQRTFKNQREVKRYKRLVRNLKKVIPYARIANNQLVEINNYVLTLETEQQRRKYINKVDRMLKEQYEEELKKLTITQGRLLIKLIDRETGNTTYHLVKELKGSFSAFLWQSLARLFGSNLKSEFDAEGEDKLINEIIILIENDQL
ncbi:MAG: DUF4294 domain-containing protein [Bacteroidales bacterium]|nr:DUF4294 domain-containing protein [Bacteroidales bacterium]